MSALYSLRSCLGLTLFASLPLLTTARIHHLVIKNDNRFAFSIEPFGFLDGGVLDMKVSELSAQPADAKHIMGFVVFPTASESGVSELINTLVIEKKCIFDTDALESKSVIMWELPSEQEGWANPEELSSNVTAVGDGTYDLFFTHCSPAGSTVSFRLDYAFINPGGHYLSAGEIPLPWMYGVITLLFAGATGVWIAYARRNKQDIHKIHYLMTMLVVVKTLTVLFESVMYHFIDLTGHSTGWNIVFYILTFVRGILLIVVIALIGAGWSLLKPFLNAKEKKILLAVIPLQILNNIALIVIDENDPGTVAFGTWVDVLRVVDIILAGIVLFPIIWSIRHLRTAQEADRDEKTKDTLIRLTQFRSFYLTTMVWLYFTRILVVLMADTLPIQRQWLAAFFDEVATLAYYLWVGYRFRPAADNSDYLRVPNEEDGVPSAELEMPAVASAVNANQEDKADAKTSSSSTRVVAPSQSMSRASNVASESETSAGSSAIAPARKKQIAIADDENDDEFGVDDDDLEFHVKKPVRVVTQSAGGSGSSAGGLKNVKSRVQDDDDDF